MPAASDPSAAALPVTFRPRGFRVTAVVVGALFAITVVVTWLALPNDVQDQFTLGQRLTLGLIGLGAFAAAHAMARCRIDAAERGLTVVNGYRSHHIEWNQVVSVTLRPGNPWALLDLSDGTTRAAMGIQGSDGGRARRQARELRALVRARAGQEPT